MKLKIAAKVDRIDEEYFKTTIKPMLSQPGVEYIGEINDGQKGQFLGDAAGLIFAIQWREPFGLAMIEAMACGIRFWQCAEVRCRKSLTMASPALSLTTRTVQFEPRNNSAH